MPNRDWRHYAALGGLAALLGHGSLQAQQRPHETPKAQAAQAKKVQAPATTPALQKLEKPKAATQPAADTKSSNSSNPPKWVQAVGIWSTFAQAILSFFGLIGVVFTVLYARGAWIASAKSAKAAHDTLCDARKNDATQAERFTQQLETLRRRSDIAEAAAHSQLRAYVHLDRIDTHIRKDASGAVQSYDFTAVWKNYGATPARKLKASANFWIWHEAVLPPWFPFPDFPALFAPTGGEPSLLPPGKETFIGCGSIPVGIIGEVTKGWRRPFFWGSAAYEDVFGEKHITRFCWRANRFGMNHGDRHPSEVLFTYYQENNCADEDCEKADASRPAVPPHVAGQVRDEVGWLMWLQDEAPKTYERAPDGTPHHGEARDIFGVRYPPPEAG